MQPCRGADPDGNPTPTMTLALAIGTPAAPYMAIERYLESIGPLSTLHVE